MLADDHTVPQGLAGSSPLDSFWDPVGLENPRYKSAASMVEHFLEKRSEELEYMCGRCVVRGLVRALGGLLRRAYGAVAEKLLPGVVSGTRRAEGRPRVYQVGARVATPTPCGVGRSFPLFGVRTKRRDTSKQAHNPHTSGS